MLKLNKKEMVPNIEAISFSITNYCLCNCKHCLLGDRKENNFFLEKEMVFKVCDDIIENNIISKKQPIALTGGEISLHPEIVEMILGIYERGLKKINVSTTGLGFTEHMIEQIAPKVNIVSFSLDGNKQFHNWIRGINIYEKTDWCINQFKKNHVKNLAIQMSICEENYDMIDDIVQYGYENEISHIRLVPILPIGRAKRLVDRITLLNDETYEKLHLKVMELNAKYSNMDITSILDRKEYLLKNSERIRGLGSINNLEISERGIVHFGDMLCDGNALGNIYDKNIKDIVSNISKTSVYARYCEETEKILEKVQTQKFESVCVLKERLCQ